VKFNTERKPFEVIDASPQEERENEQEAMHTQKTHANASYREIEMLKVVFCI
jgi:hypothetical protein